VNGSTVNGLILFADDDESFIQLVKDRILGIGLRNTVFIDSLKKVRDIIDGNKLLRIILDMKFEGEKKNGIDLLEYSSTKHPQATKYLLTGKPITDAQKGRLTKIGAKLVDKDTLTWEKVIGLIRGNEDVGINPNADIAQSDIGEVNLRLDDERALNQELKELVTTLAGDVISEIKQELAKKKNKNKKVFYFGGRLMSINELIEAVDSLSGPGPEFVGLHRILKKELGGLD